MAKKAPVTTPLNKTLSVAAIKEGTVIDHIPAGQALTIIHLLKLNTGRQRVLTGLNLTSGSTGFKDIIKIENRFLTEKEAHDIAVFAPDASINIIKDYQVTQKIKAELPNEVERILVCPNRRCITRIEPIDSLFLVESFKNKIFLRCKYCEQHFQKEAIEEYRT